MFDACCVQCILKDSKRCSSFVLFLLSKPGQNKFRCLIQCNAICEVSEVLSFLLGSFPSILQDKKAEIQRFPALFPASYCSCQPLTGEIYFSSNLRIRNADILAIIWNIEVVVYLHGNSSSRLEACNLAGMPRRTLFLHSSFSFSQKLQTDSLVYPVMQVAWLSHGELALAGLLRFQQSFHRCHRVGATFFKFLSILCNCYRIFKYTRI